MSIFKKRGFTLIELLVVIALIAVLSAIVMSALNSARNKGGDAGVKSNLKSVQNQAAIYFTNNNTFGATFQDQCPNNPLLAPGSMFSDPVLFRAVNKAITDGGSPALVDSSWCYNDASVWATAVSLKSNVAYSWCVDSSGKSKQVNTTPQLSINTTTHLCN